MHVSVLDHTAAAARWGGAVGNRVHPDFGYRCHGTPTDLESEISRWVLPWAPGGGWSQMGQEKIACDPSSPSAGLYPQREGVCKEPVGEVVDSPVDVELLAPMKIGAVSTSVDWHYCCDTIASPT